MAVILAVGRGRGGGHTTGGTGGGVTKSADNVRVRAKRREGGDNGSGENFEIWNFYNDIQILHK